MNKPFNRPVQPIRPAATVIVVREAQPELPVQDAYAAQREEGGYEIFMLKRTSKASFASGMYVFPGGRVDGDDHLHKYDAHREGPSTAQAAQVQALGDEWRGYWIAAIRETFEEAGLMLAYNAQGELLSYSDAAVAQRMAAYRDPLHDGAVSLLEICQRERLRLAVDQIHFYNRFVTPFGRPRRFDTRFFIASAPETQRGSHDQTETVASTWITPQQVLTRHHEGALELMNVTRIQLEWLSRFSSKAALLEFAEQQQTFTVKRPVVPRDAS